MSDKTYDKIIWFGFLMMILGAGVGIGTILYSMTFAPTMDFPSYLHFRLGVISLMVGVAMIVASVMVQMFFDILGSNKR